MRFVVYELFSEFIYTLYFKYYFYFTLLYKILLCSNWINGIYFFINFMILCFLKKKKKKIWFEGEFNGLHTIYFIDVISYFILFNIFGRNNLYSFHNIIITFKIFFLFSLYYTYFLLNFIFNFFYLIYLKCMYLYN